MKNYTEEISIQTYYFKYGILALIFFMLTNFSSHGQDTPLDFKAVENQSLKYYSEGQWDQLIEFGNVALKQGHDYYYLRLRIGIAFYNNSNYFMATHHLEKALKMNQADPVILEYLYFSYIFSNRTLEAISLSRFFPKSLSKKLKIEKIPIVNYLSFSGGAILSNNIEKNKNNKQLMRWDTSYVAQTLNDNKQLISASTGINVTHQMSLNLSYQILNTQKLQQIRAPELVKTGTYTQVIPPGVFQGNIYDYTMNRYHLEYTMNQQSIYGSLHYDMGNSFNISPAFHALFISFKNLKTTTMVESYFAQPWQTDESYNTIYQITETDTSFTNYIASLNASKSFLVYNLGLTGSYSNLNGRTQYQGDIRLSWFPKGNLNFYGLSRLTANYEEEYNKFRYMFYQLIGYKISEKFWLEAFATFGEMLNFNESNGFIVFNSDDILKFRTGLNFIVPLSTKIELSFRYHFSAHQGWQSYGYDFNDLNTTSLNYENQLFLGGITWKN